jgi:hypothetical protein
MAGLKFNLGFCINLFQRGLGKDRSEGPSVLLRQYASRKWSQHITSVRLGTILL